MPKPSPRVCVVGSSNLDMNAYVERFPQPGETLHGLRFTTGYGGKGANQAVMAARLGACVHFLACVGNDLFGRDMLDNFRQEGIDCTGVRVCDGGASGVAIITIDSSARNQIVVIPGANGLLTAEDVEAARALIEAADVLACQMEVPLEANLAAIRIASLANVPVIFNPAPAPAALPREVYRSSTILCLNETEAAILSGQAVETLDQATSAARLFLDFGAKNVLLTLGPKGCLFLCPEQEVVVPAPVVKAVDTTGAGDAFIGSLAFDLARGCDLVLAAERACRVAAISVQFPGTQTSYPRAKELDSH
jgi:ribokinase